MRISDWSSDVCSSDLWIALSNGSNLRTAIRSVSVMPPPQRASPRARPGAHGDAPHRACRSPRPRRQRSEEHTSELQSLMRISYAVFCLKKKKKNKKTTNKITLKKYLTHL